MKSYPFRIGFGYDLHRFSAGRKCILGGVEIPSEQGLLGHSDADALSHALSDALLGAAGLRDIGHYFPDSDTQNKDLDSLKILAHAKKLITKDGYSIGNIDITLITEQPKINPHVDAIKASIAQVLGICTSEIGIKATTNEGCDAIGSSSALACHCVCLVYRQDEL